MFNNRKKFVFVFVVVLLLSIFYFLFSVPTEAAETLKYEFPCVKIGDKDCPPPGETARSPAAYIARFYQFALMIAGMLAFGMLIFGGIKYTVSRGNTAQIADAKDIIYQALWGVALLLGAWLILFTIDPGLIDLTDPKITALVPKSPAPTIGVPLPGVSENMIVGKTIYRRQYNQDYKITYALSLDEKCPKNWIKSFMNQCTRLGGLTQTEGTKCCILFQ